jgi:hypothetical protein
MQEALGLLQLPTYTPAVKVSIDIYATNIQPSVILGACHQGVQ